MSFLKNKYVIWSAVAIAAFLGWKWWKARRAAAPTATTGAAAAAASK